MKLMVGLLLSAVLVLTVVGCENPAGGGNGGEVTEITMQDLVGTWKSDNVVAITDGSTPPTTLYTGYGYIIFTQDTYLNRLTILTTTDTANYPIGSNKDFGPFTVEKLNSTGLVTTVIYSGVIDGLQREQDITFTFTDTSKTAFTLADSTAGTITKQ